MTNMPTSGISESYHELNSKLLNDRIVRSVSEVVQKEIECYLAERLKDYSLYKDTYEQIMNISNTPNPSTPTCEELKKEIEDLKEQLNEYRQLLDITDSDVVEPENISLSIEENIVPDVSDIKFVEPIMPKNIEAERMSFWNDNNVDPSAPEFEESPEDDEEEITEDEEDEESEEEEEEVFEIKIKGKKYYTTDEKKKNGQIFEVLPNEDVGDHVGNFINGKCYIGADFDHLDRKQ
tara:strand:+ start:33076 stop:33783 length:708 start_codon:yes stop_codon:yes gene_type:complete